MAFIACPNCKYVSCSWDENNTCQGIRLWHNKMIEQFQHDGLPCQMCFCEMKIIKGNAPKTCHHGFPEHVRCRECHKNDPEINGHINKIKELLK